MRQILDLIEIEVLKIIEEENKPIGTWAIENILRERNIEVSTATVGRILSKLESSDFLEKYKNEGRIITTEGQLALKKAETINIINYHQEKLDKIISTEVLENFIMVIQARKAIERETTRLATRYISKEDLNKLKKIVERQNERAKSGDSIADEDLEFHRTIAKASGNSILEAMYNIIATFKQQSKLFENLRRQINSPYTSSHEKIYNAIKNNNENEAERLMAEHMDNLMEDVLTYWHKYSSRDK
ncbi:FCD domain-containing protein [Sedimentibacter hydroxybenzoicus DSM 7310]|uniref:FCD domain-containing protein n=1 Tax=Sedimentibacter hydroxybenzoicus DSM 7310 TaxID=1123245 RepID=A0A974GY29_SEDHY|nr:FCD domain-containing protein [Sedimentibacter hydroxybenzoicus]NYB75786.1 FCD domain-containing protein [Sedimentibacter hydroxybenzoicus DSM 7310]